MSRQQWEVRQGRRISRRGASEEAFIVHILDETGRSVRSRWFKDRDEADLWAKANHATILASETGISQASDELPIAIGLTDDELRRILDQGGLCSVADVQLMATELLAIRASRGAAAKLAG